MAQLRSIGPATARVGFLDALWFEWTKFVTLRANLVAAGVIGLALPVLAAIVAGTGSLQPDDTVLGASVLGGAVMAQVLAVSLGAVQITGELRSGMIWATLAACPRRLTVMAAKATVVAGAVFAVTLPSALAAFGLGVVMLDGTGHAVGQPFPTLIGVALALASIAVLGVAIGSLVRYTAGAVIAGVGVVLVPQLVAPMLGDYQRWLGGASLSGVMQKLTQSSDATHQAVGSLGAWPSLAVAAAYTVAAVGLAVWVLRRRDT